MTGMRRSFGDNRSGIVGAGAMLPVLIPVLICVLTFSARAELRAYGMVSAGEAFYNKSNDQNETTAIPQAGINAGYSTRFLTPYAKAGLGYYYQRLYAEAYAGLQAGYPFGWLKPSLTAGIGIQSYNRKHFNYGESEPPAPGVSEYTRKRRTFTPFGIGARLDAFDKVYGEWEGRVNGMPMWKIEFGYRIL